MEEKTKRNASMDNVDEQSVVKIKMMKKQGSLNVTVTDELEKKFHYMRRLSPTNEFGGFLFYRINSCDNDFKKVNITCFDALQMSVGSSMYNTFKVDGELGAYMMENDYYQDKSILCGHFHSHCNMSSSPSGTDLETYRLETLEQPVFLGLIINNSMNYTAIFTRIVEINSITYYKEKWIGIDGKEHISKSSIDKSAKVVQYIAGVADIENGDKCIVDRFNGLVKSNEEKKRAFNAGGDYDDIVEDRNYRSLFNRRISRF